MKKKRAVQNIGFADSKYKSFHMSESGDLTIFLESWDAQRLRLLFTDVIHFSYDLGSIPSELFEVEDSQVLEKILIESFGDCSNQLFKLFLLEDIEHFPFIQVVAKSVSACKEKPF